MNRQAMIEKIKSSIETSTNRPIVESPMPQTMPQNAPQTKPQRQSRKNKKSSEVIEESHQEASKDEEPQNEPEQPPQTEASQNEPSEMIPSETPTLDDMKITKRELTKAIKKNKFPCIVGKSVFQSSDELLTFNSEFLDMFNSEKKAARKNKLKAAKKDFIERFDGRAEELNLKKPRKEFDDDNYNIDSEGFVRRLSKPIGVVSGDSVIEIPKTNKQERERFLRKHENELKQSTSPREVIDSLRDTDDDAFKHSHGFSSDKTFSNKVINEFLGLYSKPPKVSNDNKTVPDGFNPDFFKGLRR